MLNIKRSIILFILLSLLTLTLCSCDSEITLDNYNVIFSASDGDISTKSALELAELTGTELVRDTKSEPQDKEILIGNTNRTQSLAFSSELLYLDYSVKRDGEKIIICGGSDRAIANGVKWFTDNCMVEGKNKAKVKDYTYRHEYKVKDLTVSGKKVKSYNLISKAADSSYNSFKDELERLFTENTGFIRHESADALNVMIKCDPTLSSDSFSIKVSTGDITISGANAYGIKAAVSYLFDTVITEKTTLNDGDIFTGNASRSEMRFSSYINARASLSNTYNKLAGGERINVVYFGGSVTSGHGASDSNAYSWRARTENWFDQTFPDADIVHLNSTIGGSGSMLGAFRCAHDVIALDADLLFIEFAVNDIYCATSTDDIRLYYESIIRQVKTSLPDCDIVTLYTTDQSRARNGNNSYFAEALAQDEVAQYYDIPSVYLGGALCSSFDYMNDTEWSKYFIDIVHPTDKGYEVYFEALREYLEDELIYNKDIVTEEYILPERLEGRSFEPKFLLPSQIEIIENKNWAVSDSTYWSTANKYEGYLYPTSADNKLVIKIDADNAALLAEYGKDNRLIYSFDGDHERIQNQKGNHPLMLTYSVDTELEEHTLTLSVRIKDETTPYIVSALLLW
ncbi:MAG: SGNH/GDSL hydrolase family protein [Clostridia bacterium]|nr:SGNH/GDSL hydrolase family protein [Clostridia bacterium]